MIEINVKKKLGSILIDADLSVPGDGITVFYGHSGAGKTSIINMVSGLLKPDEGEISVNGRVLFSTEQKINLSPDKRKVGYIFQDKRLFPFLNVRKNLLFGCHGKHDEALFNETVELLGIGHLLKRKVDLLSGGEAQRVAIGRALLSEPDILLMDEPMSFLDQARKLELIKYVQKIPARFHIPVIMVTHSAKETEMLADHVVLMENGKAVSKGEAKNMILNIKKDKHLNIACQGI